jgi:hypothetical protein
VSKVPQASRFISLYNFLEKGFLLSAHFLGAPIVTILHNTLSSEIVQYNLISAYLHLSEHIPSPSRRDLALPAINTEADVWPLRESKHQREPPKNSTAGASTYHHSNQHPLCAASAHHLLILLHPPQ